MNRVFYERHIMASGLPPMSRLVAMVLASKTDFATCEIPPRRMPSLDILAGDTGLTRKNVTLHLDRLETAGWVKRTPGGGRGRRTGYLLTTPGNCVAPTPFEDPNRVTATQYEAGNCVAPTHTSTSTSTSFFSTRHDRPPDATATAS